MEIQLKISWLRKKYPLNKFLDYFEQYISFYLQTKTVILNKIASNSSPFPLCSLIRVILPFGTLSTYIILRKLANIVPKQTYIWNFLLRVIRKLHLCVLKLNLETMIYRTFRPKRCLLFMNMRNVVSGTRYSTAAEKYMFDLMALLLRITTETCPIFSIYFHTFYLKNVNIRFNINVCIKSENMTISSCSNWNHNLCWNFTKGLDFTYRLVFQITGGIFLITHAFFIIVPIMLLWLLIAVYRSL